MVVTLQIVAIEVQNSILDVERQLNSDLLVCIWKNIASFLCLVGTLNLIILLFPISLPDSGALHGKPAYKKENGINLYASSSSAPGVAGHNTYRPPVPRLVPRNLKIGNLLAF